MVGFQSLYSFQVKLDCFGSGTGNCLVLLIHIPDGPSVGCEGILDGDIRIPIRHSPLHSACFGRVTLDIRGGSYLVQLACFEFCLVPAVQFFAALNLVLDGQRILCGLNKIRPVDDLYRMVLAGSHTFHDLLIGHIALDTWRSDGVCLSFDGSAGHAGAGCRAILIDIVNRHGGGGFTDILYGDSAVAALKQGKDDPPVVRDNFSSFSKAVSLGGVCTNIGRNRLQSEVADRAVLRRYRISICVIQFILAPFGFIVPTFDARQSVSACLVGYGSTIILVLAIRALGTAAGTDFHDIRLGVAADAVITVWIASFPVKNAVGNNGFCCTG